jgi:hypothetical protein
LNAAYARSGGGWRSGGQRGGAAASVADEITSGGVGRARWREGGRGHWLHQPGEHDTGNHDDIGISGSL